MRWILHCPDGTVQRGNGALPNEQGVLHFIDADGSQRLDRSQGRLHRNGLQRGNGAHRITLDSGDTVVVNVNAKGFVTSSRLEPKQGVGGNG